MDHRVLIVSLSLWSSGLWAEDPHSSTAVSDDVRLVGGASHCAGSLEKQGQGVWRAVDDQVFDWNLTSAAAVCRQLDCGSVVSLRRTHGSSRTFNIMSDYLEPDIFNLGRHESSSSSLEITCSDSVRLVNGTGLCSGRLQVKSNQSWASVCEGDFGQREAEVVCRELGCGAPSVLQGALFEQVEAPVWSKPFQCEGSESALLDCRSSGSSRDTCSPGRAAGLTCSEPGDVRLFGGAGRCGGTLEIKQHGEWKPADERDWNLRLADAVCGQLDCGSAVSTRRRRSPSPRHIWGIQSDCDASSLIKCFTSLVFSSSTLEITCSDSVRLVNGTSLCSGRLQVKSNQSWASVCEGDFGQREAEVVCRELGCGAPSVFKGGLYGQVGAPVGMRKFQCEGSESALLDCRSSGSSRDTCSPGRAVGLTCSETDDVRLAGGASRCTGRLELKHHGDWKAVDNADFNWNLKVAAVMCRWLDCGSSASTGKKTDSSQRSVWWINTSCLQSKSTLKECVTTRDRSSYSSLEITCSDSVRLVNGTSLCSGRLQVKSNQSWASVCEGDFGQQEAEVVCRELGCGAPSVFKGALFEQVEAPVWSKPFQCEGSESALLDCRSSGSSRNTCSPGRAVGLTCSDPDNIRLVGEASRCAGTLEMKNEGEWRPVADWYSDWDHESAATVCRLLDCGSAVSTTITDDSPDRLVWWIKSSCVQSASALLECVMTGAAETYFGLEVICSDILPRPNISPAPSTDGVSEAKQQRLWALLGTNFTIKCWVEPQYQGGSFQLIFTTSDTTQNYTLPAVNHSAHFPFSAADHTHQGSYSCAYHVHVFNQNFSSESQLLSVTVSASLTELIIRLVVLLLGMTLLITALCFNSKAIKIQRPGRENNTGVNEYVLGCSSTEGWLKRLEPRGKSSISKVVVSHSDTEIVKTAKDVGQ